MKKRICFPFIILLLFSMLGTICVNAETELITMPISEKEKRDIVDTTEITKFDTPLDNSWGIRNIVMNKDGTMLALTFYGNKIQIYNKDGEFLYGFKVVNSDPFSTMFDDETNNLNLYVFRGDIMLGLDELGAIQDSYKVKDTNGISSYLSGLYFQKQVEHNGVVFELKNGGPPFGYSALAKKTVGNQEILINNRKKMTILRIGILTLSAVGLILFIVFFYHALKRKKYSETDNTKF